jgi:hypothetical protein
VLSPKSHVHDVAPALDGVASKITELVPFEIDGSVGEYVKSALSPVDELTVTGFASEADSPRSFVTVSVTVNVRACVYWWLVVVPAPRVPSPKSQEKVVAFTTVVVDALKNTTSLMPGSIGENVKFTVPVGAPTTLIGLASDADWPLAFVTRSVTL